MFRSHSKEAGFSLISALVGLGIASIVALGLSTFLSNSMKAGSHFEKNLELAMLHTTVAAEVDCYMTLKMAGINLKTAANHRSTSGRQIGPYIRLYRKTLDPNQATPLTSKIVRSGKARGAGEFGGWHLRASFSGKENSLVIRAAKMANKEFAKDQLTGKDLSFDKKGNLLFGGRPGMMPLCGVGSTSGATFGWIPVTCGSTKFDWTYDKDLQQRSCTTPGNLSPDQLCRRAGYRSATSACRGYNKDFGFRFHGSIMSNTTGMNGLNGWAMSCQFGSPYWVPPDEIQCLR